MKSFDSVNPNWVNGTKGIYSRLFIVAAKMFEMGVPLFFEQLNMLIKEFDKIEFLKADDAAYGKIVKAPSAITYNDLFAGILYTRLFGSSKYLPLYFDGKVVACSTEKVADSPVDEKYFFILWYVLVIKGGADIVKCIGVSSETNYHLSFTMGEGKFTSIIYVVFEKKHIGWNCNAYREIPADMTTKKNRYLSLA